MVETRKDHHFLSFCERGVSGAMAWGYSVSLLFAPFRFVLGFFACLLIPPYLRRACLCAIPLGGGENSMFFSF